jgi:hypothetical protein
MFHQFTRRLIELEWLTFKDKMGCYEERGSERPQFWVCRQLAADSDGEPNESSDPD